MVAGLKNNTHQLRVKRLHYLKLYQVDYSQTEAKKSPPTATPWAKQLRTVLDKAKEENKDLKGWFVIPARIQKGHLLYTYDFSSCFFSKFKKSRKRGFAH